MEFEAPGVSFNSELQYLSKVSLVSSQKIIVVRNEHSVIHTIKEERLIQQSISVRSGTSAIHRAMMTI